MNFSKYSLMTGCHHPESLMAMSKLQESVKKKLYTTIPGQVDFVPDYHKRKLTLSLCKFFDTK